jgi:pimeloyl-ACP methyl ester carboxylesterase
MQTRAHLIDNDAGWALSLHQTWDDSRLVRTRRPVLIVPGYGMNSFIFSYHPSGLSLEGYLAAQGFEVWRADLRAQGGSQRAGGSYKFALKDLALTDLGHVIDAALEHTQSSADRADILGASLGGTIMFAHAALNPAHRMGSLVSIGSPVRWVAVHPLVRAAFASPELIGALRFRGTRGLAERALPQLARYAPWLLSMYMNHEITDTSAAREMAKTVEDPNRHINREIARWIQNRDLVIDEVNVSSALAKVNQPLLCILANRDGIVPRSTAAFPYEQAGSSSKTLLEVGTSRIAMAHADLFVSKESHERVFHPLAKWLATHE